MNDSERIEREGGWRRGWHHCHVEQTPRHASQDVRVGIKSRGISEVNLASYFSGFERNYPNTEDEEALDRGSGALDA